jgi:hypothetical protein
MLVCEERSAIGGVDETQPLVMAPDSTTGTSPGAQRLPVLRGYGVVLAAVLVVLLTGAIVSVLSSGARHQLAMSFMHQPERYTELHFSAANAAQVANTTDQLSVTVSFVVTNYEGQAVDYPFVATLVDRTERPVANATGVVEVPDAKSATATVVIHVSGSAAWTAIEVNLTGRSERLRVLRSQLVAAGG